MTWEQWLRGILSGIFSFLFGWRRAFARFKITMFSLFMAMFALTYGFDLYVDTRFEGYLKLGFKMAGPEVVEILAALVALIYLVYLNYNVHLRTRGLRDRGLDAIR